MKICKNCHKQIDDDALVCSFCGCVAKEKSIDNSQGNVSKNNSIEKSPKKKNVFLQIFLWIFLLPVMITIAIMKSKKIKKSVKVVLILLVWVITIGIANQNRAETNNTNEASTQKESAETGEKNINDKDDGQSANFVDNEQVKNESKVETDLDIITAEGHPTYYGSTSVAHEVWGNVKKGKIVFADSYDKYSESTIIYMDGYSQDEKNELIRDIQIYFSNMEEKVDISLGQAVEIASSYLPSDIINEWYEFDDSYELVPNDDSKDVYHIITYHLTEKGKEGYYSDQHKYSGSIDVIINGSSEHINNISIRFGTPRWMSSLSLNGYERNEWQYNVIPEKSTSISSDVRYHSDEGINQMLVDYNSFAEVSISPDLIEKAAYDDHAIINLDGIWIRLGDNSYGQFVDMRKDVKEDNEIYPVFRDFMKTLDKSIDDEMIANAWKELKTDKYKNYDYYNLGNIEVLCWATQKNDGAYGYDIKCTCKR